jgi:hypothetical protein
MNMDFETYFKKHYPDEQHILDNPEQYIDSDIAEARRVHKEVSEVYRDGFSEGLKAADEEESAVWKATQDSVIKRTQQSTAKEIFQELSKYLLLTDQETAVASMNEDMDKHAHDYVIIFEAKHYDKIRDKFINTPKKTD